MPHVPEVFCGAPIWPVPPRRWHECGETCISTHIMQKLLNSAKLGFLHTPLFTIHILYIIGYRYITLYPSISLFRWVLPKPNVKEITESTQHFSMALCDGVCRPTNITRGPHGPAPCTRHGPFWLADSGQIRLYRFGHHAARSGGICGSAPTLSGDGHGHSEGTNWWSGYSNLLPCQ